MEWPWVCPRNTVEIKNYSVQKYKFCKAWKWQSAESGFWTDKVPLSKRIVTFQLWEITLFLITWKWIMLFQQKNKQNTAFFKGQLIKWVLA